MTDPIQPFLTDGISLGIPNTSATKIEQIDSAIFLDANGNLNFRDNFTKNSTDVLGNPIDTITLQDLYTLVKGVYVVNGQLYFKDSTTSRPYSLSEIVGAYVDWQNRLTTGGIFWIGSTRITDAECNNLMVNVDGNPNLASNTPPVSGIPRLFTQVDGQYPLYATGTQVFSIDQYLTTVIGSTSLATDGSWLWFNVPSLQITIPPMDLNKASFIIAKTNIRLIEANLPVVFRLFDITTNTELDRKAVANATPGSVEQQPVLSFCGVLPTYQQQLQALNCQCPTTNQTQGVITEPPHVIVVQFHVNDQFVSGVNDVYSMTCANISGSVYQDVPTSNVIYNALECRLIGFPNDQSTVPIVNSSIDVLIFDTTPSDAQGRKSGNATFANQDTILITFDVPFTSSEYSITLSPNMNINTWYSGKNQNGFTIRAGKKFSGTVDWIATKLMTQGDA